MLDRIFHEVTNRADDFVSPVFSRKSGYVPRIEDPTTAAVRRLLKLDDSSTDYYAVGMMRALEACPDIMESCGNNTDSGSLLRYTKPADIFLGVSLQPGPSGAPYLRLVPKSFPVSFTVGFAYLEPSVLRLTASGDTYDLQVRVNGKELYVQWPDSLGIGGNLVVGKYWIPGFQGSITHVPVGYPYKAVADVLASNRASVDLLGATGLSKEFYAAQDSIEKVAMVGLALVRSQA